MEQFINIIPFLLILGTFIGLTQSVGQGGGPVINVCLMIGLNYSLKKSIHYSYVIMLGASISSIIQNYIKSRKKNDSSIDFDLILITLPMMLSGSIIGVKFVSTQMIFKQFMSQLIKTLFFTVLLGSLIIKSIKNYMKHLIEQKEKQLKLLQQEQQMFDLNQKNQQKIQSSLTKATKAQKKQVQQNFTDFTIIIFIIGYTVLIELIRGGQKFASIFGYKPCGIQYWICNFIHFILSFIISISVGSRHAKYLQNVEKSKQNHFLYFASTGMFAGIAGGALGLGGATILVPSWLSIGIEPNKVVANSIPLIFSTSLSLFFVSLISKSYENEIILAFLILSFIASFVIRKLIDKIVQKFKIKSAVNFLVVLVLIISLVVLEPYQITKYFKNPIKFLQFGDFC